jgi:predicted amidophosphoribosyltransferase
MEVDMVMGRMKKQNRRGIEGKRKKIKDQRRSDTMIELKLLEENCLVILLIDDIYIDTNLTEFSTLQED